MDKVGVLSHSSVSFNPLPIQNREIEQGSFSSDGKNLWVWSRNHGLSVHKAPNYSLTGWLDTDGQILVSSCELEYKGVKLFALLFKHQSGSTVAIVSQLSGVLIQAVCIPESVTCICAVHETVLPGLFSTATLHHLNGAVCLGCENGCVFVLDLSLETLPQQPKSTLCSPRGCRRVHVNTANIIVHINAAASKDQQLSLDLNSQYIKDDSFHYTDPADKLLFVFDKASVTSLLHVRQLCSVLIGYSFGGFQIFSFYDNTILFTFPFSTKFHYPAVTHFTFQEPENDPKPYVYVWVARNGGPSYGRLGSSPSATLYQLGFQQKLEDQGFTYYQDMEVCIQRLEHLLWPDPYSSAKMVTCTTSERLLQCSDPDGSFSKSIAKSLSVDRTLAVFICRVIEDNDEGTRGLITVFDLNQWYHSQMPTMAWWNTNENNRKSCPFISLYELPNLDDPLLLDAKVTSLWLFNSPAPVPETHLWPESLTIDMSLLTTSKVSLCLYEGVQEQAINQMVMLGADILLDPDRFTAMCYSVQLLEGLSDNPLHDLLSVTLHYKLRSVLMAITKSVQNPGCRLSARSFIEWIKTKVAELTTEKSTMLESLTTGSGIVDQFLLTSVQESQHQLALLTDVIVEVHLNQSIPLSEEELSEIYNPAFIYSEIYQTAHWCMENGLLPQILDTDHTPMCETTFVFPVTALREKYSSLEQKRREGTLAVDLLIGEISDEDTQFKYPPESINGLLYSKLYPVTVTRHCLELYMLYDLASSPERQPSFVQSYCDRFAIPSDVMRLALSVWNVDHSILDTHSAQLLGMHFPSIYELGIQSLIDKGLYSKAIYCITLGKVSCPKLHLQALVYSGHVQKAFTILTMFEGSEEYEMLMEEFVEHCLNSPHSNKMKQLQLNTEQLSYLCSILKSQEREELALTLLLLHQSNIEAITLAREKGYHGGVLGKCLSFGSTLLPPVKETMCSEELLRKIQSTVDDPVGPPMVLSSIMPKTNEHSFTSQADVMLAVSKKIAEARQLTSDPVTPLRKNTKLNEYVTFSPRLSTIPFTSSPLSFATRSSRTPRQTPLIHTSSKRPRTPGNVLALDKADTPLKQFLARMEGFKTRMSQLSMSRMEQDITICTPRLIILDQTPNPPASILKPLLMSHNEEELTSTSRKIRFAVDDSPSLGRKTLTVSASLPESDDSDIFYSPQSTSEPNKKEKKPDVDDLAANVVIATDNGKGFDGSFIASAEDEEPIVLMDSSQLTRLGTIHRTPSGVVESFTPSKTTESDDTQSHVTNTRLTRNSLNPIEDALINPKVVISPLRTPTGRGMRSGKTSKISSKKTSTSQQPEKQFRKYSGVMVDLAQDRYKFSPPPTVAMVTSATKDVQSTSSSSEFVFSPPHLRSATREKTTTERTDKEEDKEIEMPSSSRPLRAYSSQQKRIRQVRTTQSTPRRSERLLRSAKKL